MYESILEGINDPGIFKAVWTAGGPGSGKSTAAKDLGLFALGLRPINSDTSFEVALKKQGASMKLSQLDPELRDKMRVKAKVIAGKQLDLALKGRLGLVIDSTARDISRIIKQKAMLEKLGYETAMVFVDTELETALERNKQRARTVPENIVRSSHATISKNRDKLKKTFGRNFFVIHNDGDLSDLRANTNRMFSKVKAFTTKEVNNKQAKEWKAQFESITESVTAAYNKMTKTLGMSGGRHKVSVIVFKNKNIADTFEKPTRQEFEKKIKKAGFKQFKNNTPGAGTMKDFKHPNGLDISTNTHGATMNISITGFTEARQDDILSKQKDNIDLFGFTIAKLAKTKYDPDKPIDSLDAAFKKIRGGRWSPKQWENIHKMAQGLKSLGITLKSLKGMYMGIDKQGNASIYEDLEAVFEVDRRNPAARNVSGQRERLAKHEKVLLKKMMANPKKAVQELTVTIAFFKKQVGKSLPLVQPIIKAQILKFEDMLAQITSASSVSEAGEVIAAVAKSSTSSTSIPSGPGSVGIKVKPDSNFGKTAVFDCDPATFAGCIKGKKKHGRWATYLGKNNEFYGHIKNWMSQSYRHKNFILRNKGTGEMVYARNVMGESVNEGLNAITLTKKEEKAFQMAVKKFKGVTALGRPTMTANVLTQEFRVAEGLKRDKVLVQLSKEPDTLSVGKRYYDIRLVTSPAASKATQSTKFITEENLNVLKTELVRFGQTILKRHLALG